MTGRAAGLGAGRARIWLGIGGALLLHGAAVWLLMRPTAPPIPAERARLSVRLLPPSVPAEPPAQTPARKALPALARAGAAASPTPPSASISLPRPRAPTAMPTDVPASAAAAAPDRPASAPHRDAPLDLTLRPGMTARVGPRQPALDDPRANAARPGLGERMATTLGTDQNFVEENFGDGRSRIRRGNQCVIANTSRATELDPFGQQAQRGTAPKLLGACP